MNWWGGITGHRSARHQRQKFFGVCAGEFSMDGPRNTWNIPKESFFYYFFFWFFDSRAPFRRLLLLCCAGPSSGEKKEKTFSSSFYKKKYVFIFAAAISDGRKKERIARLSFPCGTMSGRFIRATHAHSTVQVYILRLDLIIPPITSSLFLGTWCFHYLPIRNALMIFVFGGKRPRVWKNRKEGV